MDVQLDVTSRTTTATKVAALIGIGALGGLFLTAHFAGLAVNERRDGRGGGGGGPVPYTPNDLTHVGTNVRPRAFGVFDTPRGEWGNQSPLQLTRMTRQGVTVSLGTLTQGSSSHTFLDGEVVPSSSNSALAVTIMDGGGIAFAQHLIVLADGDVQLLCLPPASAGTMLYYDTRGNPYHDPDLQQPALQFDCQRRLSRAGQLSEPDDGDAVRAPTFSPRDTFHSDVLGGYIAWAGGDPYSWGDLGCLNYDLSWGNNLGCPNNYPATVSSVSPAVLAPHSPGYSATFQENIFITWSVGEASYFCMPDTQVDAYSEVFYVAGDGTLYTDPFLESPVLPSTCTEYLARGFKPDDILNVQSSAALPSETSIALTRGRLVPPGHDVPPYFGDLDADGVWRDRELGGDGSAAIQEETPLAIILRNEGPATVTIPEVTLTITTDLETFSVCVPETTVLSLAEAGVGDHVESFFVADSHELFDGPLLRQSAPCTTRGTSPTDEITPS